MLFDIRKPLVVPPPGFSESTNGLALRGYQRIGPTLTHPGHPSQSNALPMAGSLFHLSITTMTKQQADLHEGEKLVRAFGTYQGVHESALSSVDSKFIERAVTAGLIEKRAGDTYYKADTWKKQLPNLPDSVQYFMNALQNPAANEPTLAGTGKLQKSDRPIDVYIPGDELIKTQVKRSKSNERTALTIKVEVRKSRDAVYVKLDYNSLYPLETVDGMQGKRLTDLYAQEHIRVGKEIFSAVDLQDRLASCVAEFFKSKVPVETAKIHTSEDKNNRVRYTSQYILKGKKNEEVES